MSTLLQCYAVDPKLEATDPEFNTHNRMQRIGTFINGPQISFRAPVGDWIKATVLGDMMEKAGAAMDSPAGHVLTVPEDQINTLREQLHAAAAGEGGDSDPEFLEELIDAVETVADTDKVLWIGI